MKTEITVKKEVDIKFVDLEVAVRYEEEDMPIDFPGREGDLWCARITVDTGMIEGWPEGLEADLHMKICDEGTYRIIDDKGEIIASIENDYVPNSLIPGSYGDYIEMKIDGTGRITNWPKHPTFEEFENND